MPPTSPDPHNTTKPCSTRQPRPARPPTTTPHLVVLRAVVLLRDAYAFEPANLGLVLTTTPCEPSTIALANHECNPTSGEDMPLKLRHADGSVADLGTTGEAEWERVCVWGGACEGCRYQPKRKQNKPNR